LSKNSIVASEEEEGGFRTAIQTGKTRGSDCVLTAVAALFGAKKGWGNRLVWFAQKRGGNHAPRIVLRLLLVAGERKKGGRRSACGPSDRKGGRARAHRSASSCARPLIENERSAILGNTMKGRPRPGDAINLSCIYSQERREEKNKRKDCRFCPLNPAREKEGTSCNTFETLALIYLFCHFPWEKGKGRGELIHITIHPAVPIE